MKSTKMINPSELKRDWIVVDAAGKPFGRVMTEVATYLRGKHKPSFTPHVDCGDHVIVVNAQEVVFTGVNKMNQREYHYHSGYFGHVKSVKLADMIVKNPEKLFKLAARGMLPKTILGRGMLKRLRVYAGNEHPHTAQVQTKGN